MDDPLQSITAEQSRVIHRLPNFLLSTDTHACGKRKPQASALKTQAVHSETTGFPQGAARLCEQLGPP